MFKIAVCDDCNNHRERLIKNLTRIEECLNYQFEIYCFSSGEDLLLDFDTYNFDIILLDILMDKLDGIQTAKNIRKSYDEIKIIFISSYDKRIRELFSLDTIAFIDKPIDYNKLEDAISKAIKNRVYTVYCGCLKSNQLN